MVHLLWSYVGFLMWHFNGFLNLVFITQIVYISRYPCQISTKLFYSSTFNTVVLYSPKWNPHEPFFPIHPWQNILLHDYDDELKRYFFTGAQITLWNGSSHLFNVGNTASMKLENIAKYTLHIFTFLKQEVCFLSRIMNGL